MEMATPGAWEAKRTPETKSVEEFLGKHFERVDSYRFNSASIRVRVIDSRFESKSREERDAMVEEFLVQLPEETQSDIVMLLTFAPSELEATPSGRTFRTHLMNLEFESPRHSSL
jgi:hypothetical protein